MKTWALGVVAAAVIAVGAGRSTVPTTATEPVGNANSSTELLVYDNDTERGARACNTIVARNPTGTICRVLDYGDVPTGRHTHWVEWATTPAEGDRACTRDRAVDQTSTCETRPLSEYPDGA